MIKKIDLKEIIKANPNVDEKLIQKSQEQRKQLRGIRVKKVAYNIIPPFSRRFIILYYKGGRW